MNSSRVLASIAIIATLYFGSVVIIPIILSVFLFVLLDPLAKWADRRRVPRALSATALTLLFVALAGLVGWGGYGAVARVASDLPAYASKVKKAAAKVRQKTEKIKDDTQSLLPPEHPTPDVQKVQVVQGTSEWTGFLYRGLGSLFDAIANIFLIPILTFLLLLEKPRLAEHFFAAMPASMRARPVGEEITRMIHGFFIGNFAVGLGTAGLFFGIYALIGLDKKLPLALISGFLNLVPLVGAVLIIVLPLAQALLQFNQPVPFLLIIASSLLIHLTVANLVLPKAIGPRINVNSVAGTIGLIFWGWMWGAVGILLAIPLTALVKILVATHEPLRPLAYLIAEDTSDLGPGQLARMR